MRVLITGAAGMLGSAVVPAFVDAGHEVTASDLHPREVRGIQLEFLDIRDAPAVAAAVKTVRPDLVLHLAAETDLEICESSRDHAYGTNTVGTHNVAIGCRQNDASLVYISTAGVFDGEKVDGPYTEFDEARPINVYGRSKFLGEDYVMRLVPGSFVVRAGWMIGGGDRDHKFVAKVVEQLRDGAKTVRAVTDKLGTPTYVQDFAKNLLELVATPYYGLYHMACIGEGSRYDVAREIVAYYGLDVEVVPVTSEAFAVEYPAPRPRSEMMRNYMLDLRGLNRMRPWNVALRDYLDAADFRI
jgi:dTDP-4-dehydrorhamnose reductase